MERLNSVISQVKRKYQEYETKYKLSTKLQLIAQILVSSFFFNLVYTKLEIWYYYRQPFPYLHLVLLPASVLCSFNVFVVYCAAIMAAEAGIDSILILFRQIRLFFTHGQLYINELMVKKISLLGAAGLILAKHYKGQELSSRAVLDIVKSAQDVMSDRKSVVMLVGRLLMSTLFLYVGITEINRQLNSTVEDHGHVHHRRPVGDGHDFMWYKLLEFLLSLPFIIGFKTTLAAGLLSCTLILEAFTAWAWWSSKLNVGYKIHAREHFTVNMAVAGGLILLCFVGAGKYTVDAMLKKNE